MKNENVQQIVGFRIWNVNKTGILLYLSKKSATWTLPFVKTVTNHNIVKSLFLLSNQFTKANLISAVCIVNVKETVPIQLPNNTKITNVSFNYIIYDAVIHLANLSDINLPDNIRYPQFIGAQSIPTLIYKTSILNHLIKYMKKDRTI